MKNHDRYALRNLPNYVFDPPEPNYELVIWDGARWDNDLGAPPDQSTDLAELRELAAELRELGEDWADVQFAIRNLVDDEIVERIE